MSHAILSPSSAHRWLACTKSARLELQFPDTTSEAAKEGTLAHSLGELLINYRMGLIKKQVFNKTLAEIEKEELYSEDMFMNADNYAVFVIEHFEEAKKHTSDARLFLEQLLNLTDYIPEGFGTGDAIIIADGTMDLIDLKFGKGVLVGAENNKQLMVYALGALKEFDFLYDIQRVRMTIYQPRIDNFSSWELEVSELKQWAEKELIPTAAKAFAGEGEFVAGSHCKFCRAKAVCKAHADMNLQLAVYDFQEPALLTDDEIADILKRADTFKNWISAVEDHALGEAVNNSKKWPGYKLVEGRSNRKYTDETLVAVKLLDAGFAEEIIYNKKVFSISKLELALGKQVFNQHLASLIMKPPGKPALVPESDKRPEFSSSERAKQDFINV
jgi:hypothetical protein